MLEYVDKINAIMLVLSFLCYSVCVEFGFPYA